MSSAADRLKINALERLLPPDFSRQHLESSYIAAEVEVAHRHPVRHSGHRGDRYRPRVALNVRGNPRNCDWLHARND
jgi:hypothetical protein